MKLARVAAPCFLKHGIVKGFSRSRMQHARFFTSLVWSQSPLLRAIGILEHALPEFRLLERHKGLTEGRLTSR